MNKANRSYLPECEDEQNNYNTMFKDFISKQTLKISSSELEELTILIDENFIFMLNNPEAVVDPDDFEEAIIYFEDLKDNHRKINKDVFEFYDEVQEIVYKYLKIYHNISYEYTKDDWNIEKNDNIE